MEVRHIIVDDEVRKPFVRAKLQEVGVPEDEIHEVRHEVIEVRVTSERVLLLVEEAFKGCKVAHLEEDECSGR
ncbi:hypothetical protein KKC44_00045 [Patescibacteria group bacterium]|nr:hypothetical protein [Patescibacteria group bacterium]MBU2258978.1 hypothetical protein [Patescibacteria group bacterium]